MQFVRRLDERLRGNATFAESAIVSEVPLQVLSIGARGVRVEGEVVDPSTPLRTATYVAAGPRFFETVKFPVLKRRVLADGDALRGREGAVINQRFASLFFGDADPLGQRIQVSSPGQTAATAPAWLAVVGVVPTLPDFMPARPDDATVYASMFGDPAPPRAISVIVRSASKAAAITAMRNDVAALDGELPVYAIQTFDELLGLTRMGARMVGSWFQTLAAITLLLAAVGLYALTAHGVAQRRKEIGVRMTLGAQAGQVLSMFAWQTARVVAAGVIIGIAAAMGVNRLLVSFLGGVSPRDPLTFAIVTALLIAVSMLAAIVPARRATRIDPVSVLRGD
jgi:putative ABC transport system permease protein